MIFEAFLITKEIICSDWQTCLTNKHLFFRPCTGSRNLIACLRIFEHKIAKNKFRKSCFEISISDEKKITVNYSEKTYYKRNGYS